MASIVALAVPERLFGIRVQSPVLRVPLAASKSSQSGSERQPPAAPAPPEGASLPPSATCPPLPVAPPVPLLLPPLPGVAPPAPLPPAPLPAVSPPPDPPSPPCDRAVVQAATDSRAASAVRSSGSKLLERWVWCAWSKLGACRIRAQ